MRAPLAGLSAFFVALAVSLVIFDTGTPPGVANDGFVPLGLGEAAIARTTGFAAPDWREGDAWFVRFNADFACWLVVGDAREDAFVQGTSCEGGDIAAGSQIAANDYPYAGTFDRDLGSLLSDGAVIRFYDWPLENGKEWTTTWFGDEVIVRATYVESARRSDGEPHYTLEMRRADGNTLLVSYNYVPSLKWWSEFRYATGASITVEEFRRGWSERLVMIAADERLHATDSAIAGPAATRGFAITPQSNGIIIEVRTAGPVTALELSLRDPGGASQYSTSRRNVPGESMYSFNVVRDPVPGQWILEQTFIGPGECDVVVHALRIDVRQA